MWATFGSRISVSRRAALGNSFERGDGSGVVSKLVLPDDADSPVDSMSLCQEATRSSRMRSLGSIVVLELLVLEDIADEVDIFASRIAEEGRVLSVNQSG